MKKKILIGSAILGALLLICCVIAVLFYEPSPEAVARMTATKSAEETEEAKPTNTSLPTNTPGPTATSTSTPLPTSTPEPTATSTPLPSAPTCSEIMQAKSGKTDVQWDKYKEDLVGLWVIEWTARVREIGDYSILNGGYPAHLDVTKSCRLWYTIPDEETALGFSLGQEVIVTGRINNTLELFGLTLYLEDEIIKVQ